MCQSRATRVIIEAVDRRTPVARGSAGMRIIDRYVIREVLWPFVIGLFVFTFIFIIPFLIELAEDLIAKGVARHGHRSS